MVGNGKSDTPPFIPCNTPNCPLPAVQVVLEKLEKGQGSIHTKLEQQSVLCVQMQHLMQVIEEIKRNNRDDANEIFERLRTVEKDKAEGADIDTLRRETQKAAVIATKEVEAKIQSTVTAIDVKIEQLKSDVARTVTLGVLIITALFAIIKWGAPYVGGKG